MSKEFILPEKWCIIGKEEKVREYFLSIETSKGITDYLTHPSYQEQYFHFPKVQVMPTWSCHVRDIVQKDYQEITFEQFMKYVLHKEEIKISEDLSYLKLFLKKLSK